MAAKLELDFDYDALEDAIYTAAHRAFKTLQQEFKHETFYGFAIISTDNYYNVEIAANTEEGLARRVNYNRKYDQSFGDADEVLCKAYLRPIVEEYYFFQATKIMRRYEPLLDQANAMMRDHDERAGSLVEFSDAYNSAGNDDLDISWDRLIEPFEREIRTRFANVLRRLDRIHLFEMTNSRDKVTLGIHVHDSKFSPDGVLADVHLLNPENVHRKFMADFERHLEARKILYGY